MFRRATLVLFALAGPSSTTMADDLDLRAQAAAGLRRAVESYRKTVATEGGYLWRYSDDLARREGEARATATQVWVQPPGTPAVGLAYLAAHEATGDPYYRDAAVETARALVRGQLRSGGWDYRIEYDPKFRKDHAYRVDGGTGGRNVSTLDDNTTQTAIRLLMRVDRALNQKDAAIHETAVFALDSLLRAQYPNGAWPQRYDTFPDPAKFPVKTASYPDSWAREYPGKDYRGYYTFNDNALSDGIDVMFEAARLYSAEKYRKAAEKAGGFILLAQMPDPQPGWAQQYDADMHPVWARKFEPPSVTGGEAQGVMLTLLRLFRETNDKKYLEPIPRALAYYRKSLLPDGRLARFYELKTNKPLYFTLDYKLTFADNDLPTHYAFKVGSKLDAIAREHDRVGEKKVPAATRKPTAGEVKAVLAALDEKGRWVENGRLKYHGTDDPTRRVIDMRTFIRNVGILSAYLVSESEPRKLAGHTGSVLSVSYSPDGKLLASASRDKTVKLWDTRTGKLERTLTEHTADVYGVAFSPKGNLLASGSGDKTVRLWDPRTGKVIRTFDGHTDIVRSVNFSPDGNTLVSAGVDLTIRLWDVQTGQQKTVLKGHTERVMIVVFSPDGKTLASASSDKTARLWDVTGQPRAIFPGHDGGLEAVAFSPDGTMLATSSQDGTVRLWNPKDGTTRHILKGHEGEIDSVIFSPDGKTVASGCKDKTIKLWDARTGTSRKTLTGPETRLESLAFSPDGATLASGSGGPEALVWLWPMR